ncbi:tyrosine-protein phosphatase non-receptor type 21-like isoform X2 [Antedon mediterranea]|uniref:tyrosine-protein phosphatase non-receptor type 21-like isoform X2 n=1 Tax=Antedon mediterranea TaxID=105859 RepID=UPI003AF6770E
MPFGLKFKKTRRYYVSGKNSFVARIQLLDNTFMECTLSTEGTGQDCLEVIGQKLELDELMYFGLLYINKNYKLRWVELEKPLKKQLDKNAHDTLLRFGVMLYTSNVQHLNQEITRYLYFLQLKSDIIEGILPCSLEQAVLLASYAVQAEFGDYDPDRHTLEFLKDYILLPKNIKIDTVVQSELLQEVINTYKHHIGLSPDMAEIAYISEASQLDGYGQESYPAKDEHGHDLLLGASFIGIFVKHLNGQPTVYFKWNDIVNVTHSKRLFGIEKAHSEQTIYFHMEDAENAKYVWRMCNTQHQFYRINLENMRHNRNEVSLDGPMQGLTKSPVTSSIERRPTLINRRNADTQNHVITKRSQRLSSSDIGDMDSRTTVELTTNPEIIAFNERSNGDLINSHENMRVVENGMTSHALSMNSLNQGVQMPVSPMSSNLSVASNEPRNSLYTHLPAYRVSPDYDTVLRAKQKLAEVGAHSQSLGNLGVGHGVYHNVLYYEPNGRYGAAMHPANRQQMSLSYSNPNTNISSSVIDTSSESLQYPSVNQNLYNQTMVAYSTPELSKQYHSAEEYVTEKLLKNKFKPPPPYPRGSTSTPDLARHSNFSVSHSSPDLVSRRLRSSIQPVQEVTDLAMNSLSSSNVVNISNVDLSQSLPVEAFGNLHLNGNMNPVMHPLRRHDQQALNYFNSLSHMRPGYLDLSNPDPRLVSLHEYQSDPALRITHTPHHVVRPPSDFADTSDMDSPNMLYSPPPAYKHTPSANDVFFSQNGYSEMETRSPTSPVSPSRKFTPKQLERSAEMQELNGSQFALQNHHETNIVQSRLRTVSAPDALQETHFGASMPSYNATSDSSSTMSPVNKQAPLSPSHMSVSSVTTTGSGMTTDSDSEDQNKDKEDDENIIGPLKMAAMNGLTLVRPAKSDSEGTTPVKHPRDARRKILENQITEGQVFTEYEKIARKKPNASFYTAQLPDNEARNLFKDVLPYEDTRVKLATMVDNSTGYINASHVKVPIAGEIMHYIASQAPMENTVKDWWRMVWEQEVLVIVMLTALEEDGKQKCYPYWPNFKASNNMVEFGPFKIIGQFTNDSGCYITSGLTIRHIPSGEQRTIWHLQYTDWPNQGCPTDVYGFLSFIEEFQSVCRHANSLHEKAILSPVLVHCVAGVGRTGVLILTDAMINSLEHNEEINIAKMLNLIRQQRMYTIQTVGQYQFVYRTLIQSLKNTRLI